MLDMTCGIECIGKLFILDIGIDRTGQDRTDRSIDVQQR